VCFPLSCSASYPPMAPRDFRRLDNPPTFFPLSACVAPDAFFPLKFLREFFPGGRRTVPPECQFFPDVAQLKKLPAPFFLWSVVHLPFLIFSFEDAIFFAFLFDVFLLLFLLR